MLPERIHSPVIVDRDLKLLLVYADNAARFTVTVAFGLLMGYVLWGTGRKRYELLLCPSDHQTDQAAVMLKSAKHRGTVWA